MVEIAEPFKSEILNWSKGLIREEEIVKFEDYPHVTIRWGIDIGRVEAVAEAIAPFMPIRMMFGATKMFMASDTAPYDVSLIEVFGESLGRLRKKIEASFECAPTFQYFPHLTLAEVQPKTSMKYIGDNPFVGRKYISDYVVFRDPLGNHRRIYNDGRIDG